jgi:hypothetical protein
MRSFHQTVAAVLLCLAAGAAAAADFHPDIAAAASVPRYVADGATVAKAVAAAQASKSRPLQFAVAAPLVLGLDQGVWSTENGTAVWRARVASPGARSLGLEFSRFAMPAGGALYVYDVAGTLVQGPYTQDSQTAEGRLWTALVQSEEAVIEVRVPAALRSALVLTLGNIDHGYLDFATAAGIAKASNALGAEAGACEINVACTQGNNWSNEIRSVGVITINNQTVCSGTLINDIPQDGTPYFLTANHCGITSSSLASSVVFYWNYQSSTCSGDSGSLNQNQNGSALIAGDVNADFTLLRLNAKPSSSYNLYYAGFDASGSGSSSGVGIHHPGGDIKKISSSCTAAVQQTVTFTDTTPSRTVQAWQINWTSGVTEPGSSGSGFWNQNRQLIGVLSGGGSSCSTPTGNDYYARLDVAWTANTASSGQLKASLDPSNTGQRSVCGLDAASLAAGSKCSTTTIVATPCTAATGGGGGTTGSTVVAGSNNAGSGSGGGGVFGPWLLLLMAPLALGRRRRR